MNEYVEDSFKCISLTAILLKSKTQIDKCLEVCTQWLELQVNQRAKHTVYKIKQFKKKLY